MTRRHRPHQLPWIALTEGDVVTPFDGRSHSHSLLLCPTTCHRPRLDRHLPPPRPRPQALLLWRDALRLARPSLRRPPQQQQQPDLRRSSDDDENDDQEEEGEIYDSDDDNEWEGQIYHDDDDNGEGEEDQGGIDDDSSDDANKVEEDYNEALGVDVGTFSSNYSTESTKVKETGETNILSRHLIKSRGKLLMVRQHRRVKPPGYVDGHTHHVEVLAADASTGAWVPVPVGNGCALFISMNFSKCVPAPCGEVREDVIYDIDTGEVYDMKFRKMQRFYTSRGAVTWLFPPELVV
uniref:F-box domain containing protein n=1 Tax=Brachypodium distachyon TaxID=15368 RepID=C3SAD4_BRADI|nr:F-box domain containing protein [Brachypodium distachyon]